MDINTKESIREGMFEWDICKFVKNKVEEQMSPVFKFGKYYSRFLITGKKCKYYVCKYECDYHIEVVDNYQQREYGCDDNNYDVDEEDVYELEKEEVNETLNTNTVYKLCLIGQNGMELVTTKGPLFSHDIGIIFCTHYFKDDALTVRLSWYEINKNNASENNTPTTSKVIKEHKPASLLEKLSNDFSSFYESKTNTDCVLKVSEAQFPVHRAVLSARSTVFSAMFHHDTAENRSGLVDIPDVDATALSSVLYYMYSGKIHGLTTETATAMYTVADKYALIELRKECLEFLRENLTIDNLCDAALLAHTHGEADLEERVLYFIENRLEDILESNQWKEFSTIKPLLANRLLGSAFISCKKKLVSEKTKIK